MDDAAAERKARNDDAFRSANERIRRSVDRAKPPLELLPFICECSDPRCTTIVRLRLEDYCAVREHPRRFVVAPGHLEEDVGVLVEDAEGYCVIEKVGRAGAVAEQLAGGDA